MPSLGWVVRKSDGWLLRGVIFGFYGSVRFGKENKRRARAAPLLAVAGASAHGAMAPGRVSRAAGRCWRLLAPEE